MHNPEINPVRYHDFPQFPVELSFQYFFKPRSNCCEEDNTVVEAAY